MQNPLSDFRTFADTGYFSCDFGLFFVHGLLPLDTLRLSHFDFCFVSAEYRFL